MRAGQAGSKAMSSGMTHRCRAMIFPACALMTMSSLPAALPAKAPASKSQCAYPSVRLVTDLGAISIAVDRRHAPGSAQAFLDHVESGAFMRHGSFYRTVRKNDNDRGKPEIDVIQGGWLDAPASIPAIEHESTRQTGLTHRDGAVSLARWALNSANGTAFFIAIGDQPALDAGGGRDGGDGQGFAVFGYVVKGMDVVKRIHALPTSSTSANPYMKGQMIDRPVLIRKAVEECGRYR
ncbi:peptidyl-prolyl cis-trans isomerase cyclophilin type [Sphingobium chlorophenolicum L-1]|uniref:peptidylprolyl isomerase n=2 Tax=Sphingobium chlorophenolicum TaxID=46429 RepID=F6F1Z7_SPHCR|nr:peptidyl-prolyl cis-trans isomerase cyclophilin type [Sphingobium chlorophenolicum L-1]